MVQQKASIFAPNGSPVRIILYTVIISFLSNFYQASSIAYTNVAEESFKAFINDAYRNRDISLSHASSVWLWSLIMNSILIGNFESMPTKWRGTCFFIHGTANIFIVLFGMILGMNKFLGAKLFWLLGSAIDYEKIIAETIKEEANKETKINIWKSLKEIFLEKHLRKAVILGICALQTYASALFGVNFLAGFAGVYLVGRMSRRLLLIGSGAVNTLSLTGYIVSDRLVLLAGVTFFDYGCIISLFFYNLSYGIGFGIIVFYISSELLPQFHRSLGQSVVFCITIPISFCFSFVTLPAYEAYNVWAFIPLFILPSILALLYLYINLPETNGREIFEIVEELKMSAKDRARNNALRN
ncbi:sugar transporter domain-containing protein [Ditylenchus destructor]|nr:sugar transporter domain-containing protein [Ditylenchus destructor]